MKRFKEKTVVITGAGSNIGGAVALRMAHEGANVVLIDNCKDRLEATVQAFPQDYTWIHSDHHFTIVGDISNAEKVTTMIDHIIQRFGRIDVVVNTIGYSTQQFIDTMSNDDIVAHMQALQKNADSFSHATYPYLAKTKGNIVNILTYPSNKQDDHLTRQLAVELAKGGVRVNSVDSSMVALSDTNAAILLDRAPEDKDIAAGIAFLASNDATMITGITLPIDAGISALKLS